MKTSTCDTVRDRLPGLATGEVTADEAFTVERHLAACAECAGERDVLTLLRSGMPEVPAGLEARIARAVRVGTPVKARTRPVPSYAVAAGLACVVLTGSLLLRNGLSPLADRPESIGSEVSMGWPTVDPILRAAPVLTDLTVEQLESLLAELES